MKKKRDMRWVASFLPLLTLATGCVLEDKPVIPEDGGVEAGPCGICDVETPACTDDLACVECTENDKRYCTQMMQVCKTGAFECVDCNESAECPDPDTAHCNAETNECEGCQSDADCNGINGLPRCQAETCVQCTPATEEADCGGDSCNPATFTCTGTAVGSLDICAACVADSECGEDGDASEAHRCVEMFFSLGERFPDDETGFCLKTTESGCEQPYSITLSMRSSLSGPSVDNYCGINEQIATCPAVKALFDNQTCPSGNPEDCPQPSGLCEEVGSLQTPRCTYRCASVVECLENNPNGRPGSTCGSSGSGDDDYCGG